MPFFRYFYKQSQAELNTQFRPGQLLLYSDFSTKLIFVVEVLSNEEAKQYLTPSRLDHGVPVRMIEPFADKDMLERSYKQYTVIHPSNLSRDIDELIEKQTVLYPDMRIRAIYSPHIQEIGKKYPQLGSKSSIFDRVESHYFNIRGHSVLVIKDPKLEKSYGHWQPHHRPIYYWYLPDEDVRSQSLEGFSHDGKISPEAKKKLWEVMSSGEFNNGVYKTVEDAANAAEKYIDFFLYGEG